MPRPKLTPAQRKLIADLLDHLDGDYSDIHCWILNGWSKQEDGEITKYYLNHWTEHAVHNAYGRFMYQDGISEVVSKSTVNPLIKAGILTLEWISTKTARLELAHPEDFMLNEQIVKCLECWKNRLARKLSTQREHPAWAEMAKDIAECEKQVARWQTIVDCKGAK